MAQPRCGLFVRTAQMRRCILLYYGNTVNADLVIIPRTTVRNESVRVEMILNTLYNHHDNEHRLMEHILNRRYLLAKGV